MSRKQGGAFDDRVLGTLGDDGIHCAVEKKLPRIARQAVPHENHILLPPGILQGPADAGGAAADVVDPVQDQDDGLEALASGGN